MDRYEYNLKLEQMKALIAEKKYQAAAEIADTINWRKVKNVTALVRAGEIYENVERFEEAKNVLLMAYDRSPIGRTIIYRLACLAIKTANFDEAQEYYNEFVEIAPHDVLKYVLKYELNKAKGADYAALIQNLEELKEQEFSEEWGYELACLYHQAGMSEQCVDVCDEIVLYFGEGPYVERALELKMLYEPLTYQQEAIYRQNRLIHQVESNPAPQETTGLRQNFSEAAAPQETAELRQDFLEADAQKEQEPLQECFDTINLQKTLQKDIQQIKESGEEEEDLFYIQLPLEEETDAFEPEPVSQNPEIVLQETETIQPQAGSALEPEKVRALQEAGDIMERLADVIPSLDADFSSRNLLKEQPLTGAAIPEEHAARMVADMNELLQKEIDRLSMENTEMDEKLAVAQVFFSTEASEAAKEAFLKDEIKEPKEEEVVDWLLEPKSLFKEAEEVQAEEETEEQPKEALELDFSEKIARKLAAIEKPFAFKRESKQKAVRELEQEAVFEPEALAGLEQVSKPEVLAGLEQISEPEVLTGLEQISESEALTGLEQISEPEVLAGLEQISEPEALAGLEQISEPEALAGFEQVSKPEQEFEPEILPVIEEVAFEALPEVKIPKKYSSLTKEEKDLFTYFIPVKGMEEQICTALAGVSDRLVNGISAGIGNLIIEGSPGSGKTVLAIDFVKALQLRIGKPKGKVGRIAADVFNKKDIDALFPKIAGGCLIIEEAGKLSKDAAARLAALLKQDGKGTLAILEDTKYGIRNLLDRDKAFAVRFSERIRIPIFTSDELVIFAKAYAAENGYVIDEMATLALYNCISSIQNLTHETTIAEVKEIVDNAIDHAEKGAIRKALSVLTSARYDEEDYVILHEKDFTR